MQEQAEKVAEWLSLVAGAIDRATPREIDAAAALLEEALNLPGPLTRAAVENLKATARTALRLRGDEQRDKLALLGKKVTYVIGFINAAAADNDTRVALR